MIESLIMMNLCCFLLVLNSLGNRNTLLMNIHSQMVQYYIRRYEVYVQSLAVMCKYNLMATAIFIAERVGKLACLDTVSAQAVLICVVCLCCIACFTCPCFVLGVPFFKSGCYFVLFTLYLHFLTGFAA